MFATVLEQREAQGREPEGQRRRRRRRPASCCTSAHTLHATRLPLHNIQPTSVLRSAIRQVPQAGPEPDDTNTNTVRYTTMAIFKPPVPAGNDGQAQAPEQQEQEAQNANADNGPIDEKTRFQTFVSSNPAMKRINSIREVCGDIVNHPKVQVLIVVLIVINALSECQSAMLIISSLHGINLNFHSDGNSNI